MGPFNSMHRCWLAAMIFRRVSLLRQRCKMGTNTGAWLRPKLKVWHGMTTFLIWFLRQPGKRRNQRNIDPATTFLTKYFHAYHRPSKNNASYPHHQASFEWRSRHSLPTHPQTTIQSCSPRWYFARQWSTRCYTGHPTLPRRVVVSLANGHPHDEIWIEPPEIISLPLASWQNFVPSPELHIDQDKHNFCPTSLEATRTGLGFKKLRGWPVAWLMDGWSGGVVALSHWLANCLILGR